MLMLFLNFKNALLSVALIILCALSTAHAQSIDELLNPPQATNEDNTANDDAYAINRLDIPDEYLEESFNFYNECKTTPKMNKYYDCKCLSVKYLDRRMDVGKLENKTNILQFIGKYCADSTHAAGIEYSRCLGNLSHLPKGTDPEKYCECYANTYSKLYTRSNSGPSTRKTINTRTRAMITCQRPELAKELYPFQAP